MKNPAVYTKAFVALGGFVASGVTVSADGHISLNDIFVMVLAALTAIGVYAFPNARPVAEPPTTTDGITHG